MKKISLIILLLVFLCLVSCGEDEAISGGTLSGDESAFGEDITEDINKGYFEDSINQVEITCVSGTQNAYSWEGNTLTFSNLNEDSVYSISGQLKGNIVIDVGESKQLELELCGFSLISDTSNPVMILSGDKVEISAKNDTQNYIYDKRAVVDETDETLYSGAVISLCDLEIKGKGELVVSSDNNKGIHTKDDLEIKNVSLTVVCVDNALKGNDSVTIESGKTMLIASAGDGIKTTNSNVSEKGNQRGTVTILGGEHSIFAGCDGIDAAYNVIVSGESTRLNIYTGKYSNYTNDELISIAAIEDNQGLEALAATDWRFPGGMTKPGGGMGRPGGGMGGFGGGNTEKSTQSAKGIKASNEIVISGGTLNIKSHDDSLHSNNDVALENGASPLGSIKITGGKLELYSSDDGIHADGELLISQGEIRVTNSYEGLEGASVNISGGSVLVSSRDDGINGTATTGTSVTFDGGNTYVYCLGDGIDANSRERYGGILFNGGNVAVISNSGGNSSIDSEGGYKYTGGNVLALMPTGGMTSEATNCESFSSYGLSGTVSVSPGDCLAVSVGGQATIAIKMPTSLNSYAVYLGSAEAEISVVDESTLTLDNNGLYFSK